MLSNFICLIISRIRFGKFNKKLVVTFLFLFIFGTKTILFRDDFFIKLKVTVVYWLFSFFCLYTHVIGNKHFIKYLFKSTIFINDNIRFKINKSYVVFFFVIVLMNLFVIMNYDK